MIPPAKRAVNGDGGYNICRADIRIYCHLTDIGIRILYSPLQVCTSEVCTSEVCTSEVCTSEVCTSEVCTPACAVYLFQL